MSNFHDIPPFSKIFLFYLFYLYFIIYITSNIYYYKIMGCFNAVRPQKKKGQDEEAQAEEKKKEDALQE
jgi:hypothetical protein